MIFIQLDDDNRVIACLESDFNPDEDAWIESPWTSVQEDFSDWIYEDGTFRYDPRDIPPAPITPEQVFTAVFVAKPEMLDDIPDETLMRMAPFIEAWDPNATYAVGDIRSYEGRVYRCLQPHTAQESWNPEDSPSLWARVLSGQDGEIGVWEQPDSTNPYMKGDRVHYPTADDPVYESDVDNNVWPPDQYGWHQLLEEE